MTERHGWGHQEESQGSRQAGNWGSQKAAGSWQRLPYLPMLLIFGGFPHLPTSQEINKPSQGRAGSDSVTPLGPQLTGQCAHQQASSQDAPSENAGNAWTCGFLRKKRNYVCYFMTTPQFSAEGHYPCVSLFPFSLSSAPSNY